MQRRLTGGEDLRAANTLDHPDRVGVTASRVPFTPEITLPPASLTSFEIALR